MLTLTLTHMRITARSFRPYLALISLLTHRLPNLGAAVSLPCVVDRLRSLTVRASQVRRQNPCTRRHFVHVEFNFAQSRVCENRSAEVFLQYWLWRKFSPVKISRYTVLFALWFGRPRESRPLVVHLSRVVYNIPVLQAMKHYRGTGNKELRITRSEILDRHIIMIRYQLSVSRRSC